MPFVAEKSIIAYLSYFVLLGLGCAQDDLTDSHIGADGPTTSSVALSVCGKVANGNAADINDFPWRASLYVERDTSVGPKREFICGATIIHANLLVTSAQCVSHELFLTVDPSRKLFVLVGNTFRDYDSPHNDVESVKKAVVKRVHVNCGYHGILGRWAKDIALLELQEPFQFSDTLSPVCLDDAGYSEEILESGAYGKVAGFGSRPTSESDDILHTLTLSYLPRNQCQNEFIADDRMSLELFTKDKFCAGYNGSAVCRGHRGNGMVFQRNGIWYLMGIHSNMALGKSGDVDRDRDVEEDRRAGCPRYLRSLYTRVSLYTAWIQDVTSLLEQGKSIAPCTHTQESVQQAIAEALDL